MPTIGTVEPYTPLELIGRDIYQAEGCYNCHSQMIRPILAETKRYGEYSKAGEFVFHHPFQWGSRRIRPDLAREGGKQTFLWHALHFQEPQQITQGSIMPAYPWLLIKSLNFNDIPARMNAMRTLGVPDSQTHIDRGVEAARTQAAEIAARIEQEKGPGGTGRQAGRCPDRVRGPAGQGLVQDAASPTGGRPARNGRLCGPRSSTPRIC